jgi:osmotically-inducible protein OsmY
MRRAIAYAGALTIAFTVIACSSQRSYKENVSKALEQADLKGVTVAEDAGKNVITLGGTLHSEDAKTKAGEVAKSAAGPRIVANQLSVQPVGAESESRKMQGSLDDGIENNYKAALLAKGLDKQGIHFDAKNGVLTLQGDVKTPEQREQAQQLAANIPNVEQVINEIQVRR